MSASLKCHLLTLAFVGALASQFAAHAFCPTVVSAQTPPMFLFEWGSNGTGPGQFDLPKDVAFDSSGNVYITDQYNHRVQKFSADGTFIQMWGTEGTGPGQFLWPTGIAIDSNDDIFVAEQGRRIQKFTSDGQFISTFASPGCSQNELENPNSLSCDGSDNVYVSDGCFGCGYKILEFDNVGTGILTWDVAGECYDSICPCVRGVGVKDNGGPVSVFAIAAGITVFHNEPIHEYDTNGNLLNTFGSYGDGFGQFVDARDVEVDQSGNIYISDIYGHSVIIFDGNGNALMEWGEAGTGPGQMDYPGGLGIHPNGNIYVVLQEIGRIQVYQPPEITGVGEEVSARMRVYPPFPNPSHSSVTVPVEVGALEQGISQHASVQVFSINGRIIDTLFEGALDQGLHHFVWNRETASRAVPGGIYLLRVTVGNEVLTKKMMLLQ